MSAEKRNTIIAIVLNFSICIMEIVACTLSFLRLNTQVFKYFTELSNTFTFFACLLMGIFQIRSLKSNGNYQIPQWVRILKYIAVCCLTLTFLTVVALLAPSMENGFYIMLLSDSMLYMHFICPVVAFVGFVFFEKYKDWIKNVSLIALLPNIIYGTIMIILCAVGTVADPPYFFLDVKSQSALTSVMFIAGDIVLTYLINLLVIKLNKGFKKK